MFLHPRPYLTPRADASYFCADLRALYFWLEQHGYPYMGAFGPNEYGRFACQAHALGGGDSALNASYISVLLNGTVVASDEQARQFLSALATHTPAAADQP